MTFSLADILAARRTIRGVADATPFVPSPFMSAQCGQDFLLKLENMQPIGAFKLRGAYNAVMALPRARQVSPAARRATMGAAWHMRRHGAECGL